MTRKQIVSLLSILLFVFLTSGDSYRKNQKKHSPTPTKIVNKNVLSVSSDSAQVVRVLRVVDGDTIELETKQKVRYIGINTPETNDPRVGVECFGTEAKEKNKQLVEGKFVRLEKDISETDRYGRLLRYIFLSKEGTSEALFVNKHLVEEGYALSTSYPPDVKYQELFRAAQQKAQEQNKGLWGNCR